MDYEVRITGDAADDLDEIHSYISEKLQAPVLARRQMNRLQAGIESLEYMPERFRLFEIEPWRSRNSQDFKSR